MHGHNYARPERGAERLRLICVNGVKPADGKEQHVHVSQRPELLLRERMAQIAQMHDAQALGVYNTDEVFTAQPAPLAVMKAGDKADFKLRLPAAESDARGKAMVRVPMAAKHPVRRKRGQAQPRNGAGGVGVGDKAALRRIDFEAGVAVPCYFHIARPFVFIEFIIT